MFFSSRGYDLTSLPTGTGEPDGEYVKRCRIVYKDKETGKVVKAEPWHHRKDEEYLKEWVDSLKRSPLLEENTPYVVLPASPTAPTLSDKWDIALEYD